MKTFSLFPYVFLVLTLTSQMVSGTSLDGTVDTPLVLSWPFDQGTENQEVHFSGETADYFSLCYVTVGSNLAIKDKNTTYDITYTRFQPFEQLGAASEEGRVSFQIRPKTGLTFLPTQISFDCMRFGTDGGRIDVVWRSSDGTKTTLASGLVPARNNSGAGTQASYSLAPGTVPAVEGEGALDLFIYSLGNTKQVGLANIRVEGVLTGTVVEVRTFTVETTVLPDNAGAITLFPLGTEFDEGTGISFTATRNFGFRFSHWENASGETVSNEETFNLVLLENQALTAIFEPVETHALSLQVEGGAKEYMIGIQPSGTLIDGQLLYEAGTRVTLSAHNNPLFTFTHWGGGETSSDLEVIMNSNQSITAHYSARDYIVGWDFYPPGNNGRVADFYADPENESAALVLLNAEGTTTGWLDKSQVSAGGYEGRPGAVNWMNLDERYYYQIHFHATGYTDLKVASAMLLNYNAWSVQRCEYSSDGETFTTLGTFNLASPKVWYEQSFDLPPAVNHAADVYIRWIPDYSSDIVGSSTNKDGTALSSVYVTATAQVYDDGIPPVLSSTVPGEGAEGASATGKIVLNFDEKVKITDTKSSLNELELTPLVSGKTITFAYAGLDYGTLYTFTLPGNTVSDLAGNTHGEEITLQFTTMTQPTVAKRTFDFIVGRDGDFGEALAAATAASSSGQRFYIFFPDGEYNLGEETGDGNQMTSLSLSNISFIGENADRTVLFNRAINESINSTATVHFSSSVSGVYMQDVSLLNKATYRNGTDLSSTGRFVALWDQGTKNIYRNVKLLSNQDTYYTGSGRIYLEKCEIHGTVDFICGGGDLFFNECLLYLEERSGNCITAPASSGDWGYVFMNCTIDGPPVTNGSYRLGRPWSNAPKCVYLNTSMNVLPVASGWGDPMNVVPARFAEYNSMTSSGAAVDLGSRRTSYSKDGNTVTLNPVLTDDEAARYTPDNVVGGDDAWQPRLFTEQAAAPVLSGSDRILTWNDSPYVLCWAVCIDGKFVEFVTANRYEIPDGESEDAIYTVRAANEMGGLGEPSNGYSVSGKGNQVRDPKQKAQLVGQAFYSIDGRRLPSPDTHRGIVIIRSVYSNGTVETKKIWK